jgi:hypothetical protein
MGVALFDGSSWIIMFMCLKKILLNYSVAKIRATDRLPIKVLPSINPLQLPNAKILSSKTDLCIFTWVRPRIAPPVHREMSDPYLYEADSTPVR